MQIEISITDLEKMYDRYCKFPDQTESQEALEAICSFCPLTQIQSLLVSEENSTYKYNSLRNLSHFGIIYHSNLLLCLLRVCRPGEKGEKCLLELLLKS